MKYHNNKLVLRQKNFTPYLHIDISNFLLKLYKNYPILGEIFEEPSLEILLKFDLSSKFNSLFSLEFLRKNHIV